MSTLMPLAALTVVIGQPPAPSEPEAYTIDMLIEAALSANEGLTQARRETRIQEAKLEVARSGQLPRLRYTQVFGLINEARGDATFSPDEVTDFLDGLGPFTRLELEIIQPIYSFGRISSGIEAAEYGVTAARAGHRRTAAEVIESVRKLHDTVLLNEELGRVIEESLDAMEKAHARAKERLEEGTGEVTQTDVLKIEVSLAQLRSRRVEIQKAEQLSRLGLRRAIGLGADEPMELAESKLEAAEADIGPLASFQASVASRPEIAELRAGIGAGRAEVARARAELFPTLFIAGVVRYAVAPNRGDQKNPFVRDDFNFIEPGLILGLDWNASFVDLAEIGEEQAKLESRSARLTTTIEGIRLQVTRAYAEVEAAKARLGFSDEARVAARSLLAVTAANYELGIGDAEEILEALGQFLSASSAYFLAIYEYNLAAATLRRAAGFER